MPSYIIYTQISEQQEAEKWETWGGVVNMVFLVNGIILI